MTERSLTPLSLALTYADAWPVFPCRSVASEYADPHTGEIVTMGEKTPLTSNGFKAATKNRRIIERWWTDWPDAAVGLPTGSSTGFFALDVDNKPGGANGFDWLSDMEQEHGPLPRTARVISPNGGMHLYFNYVAGTRNRGALGAGVDVRSEGGYVLAADSVMANGRRYEWADDVREIADAPAWLLELLLPKSAPDRVTRGLVPATNSAYVDAAVDRELSELASMPMGNRNNALNDSAFALGTFVGAGALSEAEARALLQDVARGWGRDWARCCKTIENGLAAGIRNPRDIPAPDAGQDNTRLVDISRMIENARRKAGRLPVREEQPAPADDNPDREADPEPAAPPQSPPGDIIHATPFNWINPKDLARREFAFGTHYIRKYVSVTVAPGGLGKTANSIVEALAMSSGKPLNGTKPDKPLKVWVFNAEDPRDELERRIMAAAIHFRLKPEDFEGRLFLDSGREQDLVVARDDKKAGVKIVEPVVEAVASLIMRLGIDVMIVDPFVSTHRVNENDNGAIDAVAKLWAQVANDTNCSIDIVHHLRKVSDREATVEDARGAVSLIGAARSVRVLNRMTPEQAAEAGLKHEERLGMFSITYGKSNLTPMSHQQHWRRLESVPLGNGQGLLKPQDFAPVVTEWAWPSAEQVSDGLTPDQLRMVKTTLDNADFKPAANAKNWAGGAVAYALGLDIDDPAERRRATLVYKALLKQGRLKEVRERDPVSRKDAAFIRSEDYEG